jgi:hypothetical protein
MATFGDSTMMVAACGSAAFTRLLALPAVQIIRKGVNLIDVQEPGE